MAVKEMDREGKKEPVYEIHVPAIRRLEGDSGVPLDSKVLVKGYVRDISNVLMISSTPTVYFYLTERYDAGDYKEKGMLCRVNGTDAFVNFVRKTEIVQEGRLVTVKGTMKHLAGKELVLEAEDFGGA